MRLLLLMVVSVVITACETVSLKQQNTHKLRTVNSLDTPLIIASITDSPKVSQLEKKNHEKKIVYINKGFLKIEAEKLLQTFGYEIDYWGASNPYLIAGFSVDGEDLSKALNQLLRGTSIKAEIIVNTNKIIFYDK